VHASSWLLEVKNTCKIKKKKKKMIENCWASCKNRKRDNEFTATINIVNYLTGQLAHVIVSKET
jgi:hypothetical protein